jgi:hypothetical protein
MEYHRQQKLLKIKNMIKNKTLEEFVTGLFNDLKPYENIPLINIYFYLTFDGGCSVEPFFMDSDKILLTSYELNKKYRLKLLKRDDLFYNLREPFQKYLNDNLFGKSDIVKSNHPKHIRVTYNIKTQKLDYEYSYVEVCDFLWITKVDSNTILDEWIAELKSGKKNENALFYKNPEDRIYYWSKEANCYKKVVKEKEVKLPKVK